MAEALGQVLDQHIIPCFKSWLLTCCLPPWWPVCFVLKIENEPDQYSRDLNVQNYVILWEVKL